MSPEPGARVDPPVDPGELDRRVLRAHLDVARDLGDRDRARCRCAGAAARPPRAPRAARRACGRGSPRPPPRSGSGPRPSAGRARTGAARTRGAARSVRRTARPGSRASARRAAPAAGRARAGTRPSSRPGPRRRPRPRPRPRRARAPPATPGPRALRRPGRCRPGAARRARPECADRAPRPARARPTSTRTPGAPRSRIRSDAPDPPLSTRPSSKPPCPARTLPDSRRRPRARSARAALKGVSCARAANVLIERAVSNGVPDGSAPRLALRRLTLAAIGVVYGDIGTSPLYAIRECFHGIHGVSPNAEHVLGVLSLVFWLLALVVVAKYLTFVMRADNNGEGGVLSLLALVQRQTRERHALQHDRVPGRPDRHRPALRRRHDHARDLGPVGDRGPGRRPAGPVAADLADRPGDPGRPVPAAAHRHRGARRVVRADLAGLVRRDRGSPACPGSCASRTSSRRSTRFTRGSCCATAAAPGSSSSARSSCA